MTGPTPTVRPAVQSGFGRFLILALLVAACGGTVVSTAAPSVTTPAPSLAATAKPTPLSRTAFAAQHISETVPALMQLSDPTAIKRWIALESGWLSMQPDLPVLNNYRVAVQSSHLIIGSGTTDENVLEMTLDIIAEAREVPGVVLP